MSDHQYTFSENDLFPALINFPNLQLPAFGHIMIIEGDWSDLLQRLASLSLTGLCLLDPKNLTLDYPHLSHPGHQRPCGYVTTNTEFDMVNTRAIRI
jgi:hypothetical protein